MAVDEYYYSLEFIDELDSSRRPKEDILENLK